MLGDSSVITEHSRLLLCRLLDYGGEATCKQLSEKYGEAPTFYSSNAVAAAKRVYEEAECPLPPDRINEGSRWWPILFVGRHADKEAAGKYIWKLRPELKAALERLEYCHRQNYWWLNASPRVWSLSNMLIGDEIDYTLLNDKEHKRRVYQNFIDAKAGDIVIGYEANPAKQIVAFLEVSKASDGERIWFKKIEGLDEPIDWSDFSELSELQDMEFLKIRNGSLFKVAEDEYDVLLNLIREVNSPPLAIENKSFAQEDFLENVFMDQKEYLELVELLENKRNLILQGAPGVGKTYAARLLAYSILGEVDKKKVKLIQFHQNYSYEDFMMGYRPVEDRFELKKGVFYKFCREASNNPDNKYFLLIDEINRGNMSKIFGELLMLIEKTYRGEPIALAYNEELFSVPKNLYIVGMMNTADRSIALIDYALRRRFSFYEMTPAFGKPSFDVYQEGLGSKSFDSLIRQIVELNDEIAKDSSLGNGFMLGHSYFCNRTKVDCTREWLEQIVKFELVPALKEYWFDDPEKVTKWESRLLESLNA
ncbi:MAG: EVE domain-containing protein [Coriobacteriia bacterium]|nr:EVE domain-containing protein [Coriobacteriia bacterium]